MGLLEELALRGYFQNKVVAFAFVFRTWRAFYAGVEDAMATG